MIMGDSKSKKLKTSKDNFFRSLKEVNFFLSRLGKCNKGKKLYDILKK